MNTSDDFEKIKKLVTDVSTDISMSDTLIELILHEVCVDNELDSCKINSLKILVKKVLSKIEEIEDLK